ncbi:MAG: YfiR family protein [Cytophagales bacterium]
MNHTKKFVSAVLVVFILLIINEAPAQECPIQEVYSMMVFNFSKYVLWPDTGNGEFVIGVVGNQEIYKTLSTWYSGKPKGTKKFVIKSFKNATEVQECQILFIDKSGGFEKADEKVKGKGTLVVTDRNGFGAKGSCINFKTVGDKLKFELNQAAIETSNLKVSSTLTSMAILI